MSDLEKPADSAAPLVVETPVDSRPAPESEVETLTPPAELVPQPRLRERLAWYLGAMLLSCVLVFWGLRLDVADLKAPFYYDLDSLLMLPLVKATVERGFGGHWENEKMGAPGTLELYDFPVIDHLHLLVIWGLGKFVSNLLLLYNLYFLLTFPLTVLTMMIACRHLGLTLPAAAVGGLLYTFLPFHYQRWENHYFLAAYWMIPLALLPALAITRGKLPFFQRTPEGSYHLRLRNWRTLGLVVLMLATASAGAYYAFFTCAITAFAGLYAWATFRTWRASASAGGIIALIVAFGLVNHIPTFVFQAKYGRHPITDRYPEEADHYGLKITHMVLPTEDHNLRLFSEIKALYNSSMRPAETENRSASLGIVGATGLVGLVLLLLLPVKRPWPLGPLAGMTVFIVLLATIGGFGSVFNLLVTAQIRGYNRISVFVACLCFIAVLWVVDRFLVTRTGHTARRLRYPAWAAIFLVGFFDQTPYSWFKSGIINTINEHAGRFQADARFFQQAEAMMLEGANSEPPRIFCLPYCPFPETAAVHRMPAYEHARGYFHTNGLLWSFGAMKGREADTWQQDVVAQPVDEFMRRIVFRGFDAVLLDGRGYATTKEGNRAAVYRATIHHIYANLLGQPRGLPEVMHEDKEQYLIDLRPYRDLLKARLRPPYDFETYARTERELPSLIWLAGFYSAVNDVGEMQSIRRGTKKATAWLINPTDRTRRLTVSVVFGTENPGSFHLSLSGIIKDEFDIDKHSDSWDSKQYGIPRKYQLEVPPGRHKIDFRCTPPPDYIPSDTRKLCYYVMNVRVEEP